MPIFPSLEIITMGPATSRRMAEFLVDGATTIDKEEIIEPEIPLAENEEPRWELNTDWRKRN